jgi:hypothetical protein
MTYDRSLSKNLRSFQKIADGTVSPTLVYAGEESVHADGISYMNYKKIYETIAAWDAGGISDAGNGFVRDGE